MKRWLVLLAISGCASGPRAIPDTVVGLERLKASEEILLAASDLHAKFEIESQGENPSKMTGALHFFGGNSINLISEGHFKSDQVQLTLDSRDPNGINRTLTKGPSANSHRDPPASKLREAIVLGLVRMGLLHNLAILTMDRPIDKADGGFGDYVKALAPSDGHSDQINGVACRRVDFHIDVEGRDMGEASVCIADATGLPIQRKQTVHFPQGDMTVVESFTWEIK
ncbi:MAG: hypothetical protein QM817_01600 [Archangium sp.]